MKAPVIKKTEKKKVKAKIKPKPKAVKKATPTPAPKKISSGNIKLDNVLSKALKKGS